MTRLALLAMLAGTLVGCDDVKSAIHEATGEGGGGTNTSAGGSEDEGPAWTTTQGGGSDAAVAVGAHTTPAPRQLVAPGTSTALPMPPVAVDASQCKDLTDGGELKVNDYITDVIKCGQTIVGHTRGGSNNFNTRFWEKHTCWPATEQHDGGDERVYKFVAEGKGRAYFTLDTPCADLDMMGILWSGSKAPTIDSDVRDCEGKIHPGTRRERIELPTLEGHEYLIVVEGKGSEEGLFALTAQCGPWR